MQVTPNTWSLKLAGCSPETLVEVRRSGQLKDIWLLTVGKKGRTREAVKLTPAEARQIADALLEAAERETND